MTATTDPWADTGYVPVARRKSSAPAPIAWVDRDAQRGAARRRAGSAKKPRHRVRVAMLRGAYALQRGVLRSMAWIVGLVKLLAAAAIIVGLAAGVAEYGPTVWREHAALGKPESSAVKVTEGSVCAAAAALGPITRLANGVDRNNEAMRMNGILDEIGPVESGTGELGRAFGLDDCGG